jgi:hypothetical protein
MTNNPALKKVLKEAYTQMRKKDCHKHVMVKKKKDNLFNKGCFEN